MEIYAGRVESLDNNIGLLIQYPEDNGEYGDRNASMSNVGGVEPLHPQGSCARVSVGGERR
ncbi:hypothetical protein [Paraburkholderia mimosarum]|uniref:hypothetical protein n=1 Tax=Paraburkholderia mimosarum TaxID=312026 RepID=UPI000418A28F|nr:hypothetical protein [Paraburkholderia mimosarum]